MFYCDRIVGNNTLFDDAIRNLRKCVVSLSLSLLPEECETLDPRGNDAPMNPRRCLN